MTPLRISLAAAALLLLPAAAPAQNGKKIYADYHGVRYTRAHDGKLGRWEMHAETAKSKTGRKTLCYNADFMDAEGRHDIAAVAYPQAGMPVESRPRLHRIPDSLGQGRRDRRILHRMGVHGPRERQTAQGHAARGREIRLRDRRQLVRRLALLRLDHPHAPRNRHPRGQDRTLRPLLSISGG